MRSRACCFEEREYIVQYQETDLDFASRLMEEEGIYYFFKFTKGAHKLVLANTPQSHPDIPGDSEVIFEAVEGGERADERIVSWTKEQYWSSGKYTLWDHHFQLPHKKLEAEQIVMDSVQAGKVTHKLKLSGNDELEVYENPGRYAQRFDGIDRAGGEKSADLQKIFDDNKRTTGIRMQQVEYTRHPDPWRQQSVEPNARPQVHAAAAFQCGRPICGDVAEP